MRSTWKKIFALCLAALMAFGCLTACGGDTDPEETQLQTEPAPTQSPEETAVLKVLTLGHSLAVDAGHMLALIANAEGYKELKVGTLYYSGCSLKQHAEFSLTDSREYNLYISGTDTAAKTPEIMQGVTMKEALRYDYWDVILMQGAVFEIGRDEAYTNGNIQAIQKYVNEYKMNPTAIFGWNMAWTPPMDMDLLATYPADLNGYLGSYATYNNDRSVMYQSITQCVKNNILTDETFRFVIPSGTVVENALTSYLTEKDLYRDYVHASDLTRVMVSYVWFCKLTGVDHLDTLKLDVIPKNFFKSTQSYEDWVLSDGEKALILETVNNALANPFQVTPSVYTDAPAA